MATSKIPLRMAAEGRTMATPRSTRISMLVVVLFSLVTVGINHRNLSRNVVPTKQEKNPIYTSNVLSKEAVGQSRAFPRILHYLSGTSNAQARMNRVRQQNPKWTIKLWTDKECHNLLREHFPHIYSTKLTQTPLMWDIARFVILYVHGGIYLEHDIDCDYDVHFDNWIEQDTTLLLVEPIARRANRTRLETYFMGSTPRHAIWKQSLDNVQQLMVQNTSRLGHVGPYQLGRAYRKFTENMSTEQRPSEIRLLKLNELAKSGQCETYAQSIDTTDYCSRPRCRYNDWNQQHSANEVIGNETLASPDSFSACLLTMDDGHFLVEWIAYHYHTLPLRHLIVAVDPRSKTSPTKIFERWRDHGLVIEEWHDEDFMNVTEEDEKRVSRGRKSESMEWYLIRQQRLYRQCLGRLKQLNRTWTLLIDVDEYLTFNTYTKQLQTTVETPASVMSFIQSDNKAKYQDSPCIYIPRVRYGARESTLEEVANDVPTGFNGTEFQTLRFRKHASISNFKYNRLGKSILDVSRLDEREISHAKIHRPVSACQAIEATESDFMVHHYLGSWEQFSFRDDARKADGIKTEKKFNHLKDLDEGTNDGVRPWLKGFVRNIGASAAAELLQGVGNMSVAPRIE